MEYVEWFSQLIFKTYTHYLRHTLTILDYLNVWQIYKQYMYNVGKYNIYLYKL
jgi:hypothetical protein